MAYKVTFKPTALLALRFSKQGAWLESVMIGCCYRDNSTHAPLLLTGNRHMLRAWSLPILKSGQKPAKPMLQVCLRFGSSSCWQFIHQLKALDDLISNMPVLNRAYDVVSRYAM